MSTNNHSRAAHTRWYATVAVCLVTCLMVASLSVVSRRRVSADDVPPSKEEAIAEIERLGGEILIDGEKDDQPVWAVEFKEAKIRNDDLRLLASFPMLEMLNLADTAIDDEGLTHVAGCRKLKELNLSGTKITNRGLSRLTKLSELATLELNRTAVTDEGLLQLSSLKKLQPPGVFETKVTEAGLARLAAAIRNSPDKARSADVVNPTKSPPDILLPEPVLPTDESVGPPDGAAGELAEAMTGLATATLATAKPGTEEHRRAIDLLEAAVANDPSRGGCRVLLADAYVDSGNPFAIALACELYDEALADMPQTDSLLARMADAFLRLGNDELAFGFAKRRLGDAQRQPPDALLQLALIALETRNIRRGGQELQRAAQESQNPLAAKLARLLGSSGTRVEDGLDERRTIPQPSATQAFHEQLLAAMCDPLLSSEWADALIRQALVDFLAGKPLKTGREPRPSNATVRRTGQAFITIAQQRQRLDGLAADPKGESQLDADARKQTIDALRQCIVAADVDELQLRHLYRRLGMTCGVEGLVTLWSSLKPVQQEVGDTARLDLWRPLIDVCQWAALQEDWRQIRFSCQVLRELAASPTPVPGLLETVRGETSDSLEQMKSALIRSLEAEREMHANRRNVLSFQADELRNNGQTAEAEAAEARLAEFQQQMDRRRRARLDLETAVALLCQSAGPSPQPGELRIGGSFMLALYKPNSSTGVIRPGETVWFDRAVDLDSWLNAERHAASQRGNAKQRTGPEPLSLPTLCALVTEGAVCLNPEDSDPKAAEQWRTFIRTEVEQMQTAGTDEHEIRRWLRDQLRVLCRRCFRGAPPEQDALPALEDDGEKNDGRQD